MVIHWGQCCILTRYSVKITSHRIMLRFHVECNCIEQITFLSPSPSICLYIYVGVLGNAEVYTGYARLDNVQFQTAGQEGYTQAYDPRYQLSFLDVGVAHVLKPSLVDSCSFDVSHGAHIGVFSKEGVTINNNVMYMSVKTG